MTLLRLTGVQTYYGEAPALRGVDLRVEPGQVVAVLGRNGAGKTTLMRSITGLTPPRSGRIEFAGTRIERIAPHRISRLGVSLVPQGRRIFPGLTVMENLLVAHRSDRRGRDAALARAFELFPLLAQRRKQDGATLSGGEQQMLAIARALMPGPRLLLLDEPSEGLAPGIVAAVADVIVRLRQEGMTIVLVEQVVTMALRLADYVYLLDRGQVAYAAAPAELAADAAAVHRYLGVGLG